eukprot:COSAG01_NODE_55848_length_322_cov_0.928251_1_plen_47_part_01
MAGTHAVGFLGRNRQRRTCAVVAPHTPSLPMPRVGTAVAWFGLLGSS